MFGSIAIEGAMKKLEAFIARNSDKPADEQLRLLKKEMQNIKASAKAGYE